MSDWYEDSEPGLEPDEVEETAKQDREALEKANRTITNLLRKEPITYIEVAQNALIRTLEIEKAEVEQENRELRAALRAVLGDA